MHAHPHLALAEIVGADVGSRKVLEEAREALGLLLRELPRRNLLAHLALELARSRGGRTRRDRGRLGVVLVFVERVRR